MILVKLIIAVTLSQSYGAEVLKPNEPTVTKEDGGLVISFQSLWQCNEKEEYLRGLEDGRKQFAREMQDNIILAEEFWDDDMDMYYNDDFPDREIYLNALKALYDCNYDDEISMGWELKDC